MTRYRSLLLLGALCLWSCATESPADSHGSDATPPETTILSMPANPTSSTTASFAFAANENDATFACKLDGAAFAACTSPASYDALANGMHTFEVEATDAAGNVDPTPATFTWTIDPNAPSDAVVTIAGDIAGGDAGPRDDATAALVFAINPTVALTAGDNAYVDGTLAEYLSGYEPTWGQFKAKTRPVPGNHDYHTTGAAGYFDYFNGVGHATGAAGDRDKGYYSFDVGSWHMLALNSEISMSVGSAQEQWLRADLSAHPGACVLAYWHQPRFTSGAEHGPDTSTIPIWRALYDAGAEVVVAGHNHQYERFARQNPNGAADPAGMREFVVGTGGNSLYAFNSTPAANSEVRNNDTWGVLKLTLHQGSYDWQFTPAPAYGTFTDSGTEPCH